MNKFIQYVLALCVLFSMPSFAKLPPSISTGGGGLNIIFAIDVSGSMLLDANQGAGARVGTFEIKGNQIAIANVATCNIAETLIGWYITDNTDRMLVQNNTTIQSLSWKLN